MTRLSFPLAELSLYKMCHFVIINCPNYVHRSRSPSKRHRLSNHQQNLKKNLNQNLKVSGMVTAYLPGHHSLSTNLRSRDIHCTSLVTDKETQVDEPLTYKSLRPQQCIQHLIAKLLPRCKSPWRSWSEKRCYSSRWSCPRMRRWWSASAVSVIPRKH